MRKFILILLLVCAGGAIALTWRQPISPLATGAKPVFEQTLVKRGEILAAMGNCASCHTPPGGKGLEGGLAIPTPFGSIHSTNITPDRETGIGRWPEAAFARAMREGIDIGGGQLYPAFPYDHYTLLSDEDVHALYAYVMTREPVRAVPPANDLQFPFNFRPAIAAWKALYFRNRRFQSDPSKDQAWNRGAYLAEGLAHCGACHTPRDILAAEKKSEAFNGAPVEGWYAYAINGTSPAPVPWTQAALEFYLGHGWQEHHGIARGPMIPVVMNLRMVPKDDVRAIATYVAGLAGPPSGAREAHAREVLNAAGPTNGEKLGSADSLATVRAEGNEKQREGAMIYAGACASCHESGRPLPNGALNLKLSTAVNGPDPSNIVNVTLFGLPQQPGSPGPIMPGFRGSLTDRQMVSLLEYVRGAFSSKPAWTGLEQKVTMARAHAPRLWPTPGSRALIANSAQEVMPW